MYGIWRTFPIFQEVAIRFAGQVILPDEALREALTFVKANQGKAGLLGLWSATLACSILYPLLDCLWSEGRNRSKQFVPKLIHCQDAATFPLCQAPNLAPGC
jgi:hypothetical protein